MSVVNSQSVEKKDGERVEREEKKWRTFLPFVL